MANLSFYIVGELYRERGDFEFLIFKCSEGTEIDPYFEQNMSQANVYEIPAGVYCYNAYDMTNTTSMDDFLAKQKEN